MADYSAQIARLFMGTTIEVIREPKTCLAIAGIVADDFQMPLNEIMGMRRNWKITFARHIAQWLCKKHLRCSLAHIGRRFDRDHTSVIKACKKIEDTVAWDVGLADRVSRLSNIIEERWP